MSLALIRRQIDELGERLAPTAVELQLEKMAETPDGRSELRTHKWMAEWGLLRPLPEHLAEKIALFEESDREEDRARTDALHRAGFYRIIERVMDEQRDETLLLLALGMWWKYAETQDVMEVYGLPGWESRLIEMTTIQLNLSGLTRRTASVRLREEIRRLDEALDHRTAELAGQGQPGG